MHAHQKEQYERSLDALGRVCLPIEFRRKLKIGFYDPMLFMIDGNRIILEKAIDRCVMCGSPEIICRFHERPLCSACMNELLKECDQ